MDAEVRDIRDGRHSFGDRHIFEENLGERHMLDETLEDMFEENRQEWYREKEAINISPEISV